MTPVVRRWDRSPDLVVHGVSFLLYGLLDIVIDGYFDAVQSFDDYYDDVSAGLFNDRPLSPDEQRHWFEMRRALVRLHRLVVPMREAISGLMRREHATLPEILYPYYQDVYDHVLRVSESTDSLRELVSTIVETNISLRDYRQNQVMKKVTSWAAIVAVPTLITGWYGQNVPYPGSEQTWGVYASAGLCFAVSGSLYLLFRRRGWLYEIVQAVDFVAGDPAYAGTMTMTWEVTTVDGGTRVNITADDVPDGISAEDHAAGLASSLTKLADRLER